MRAHCVRAINCGHGPVSWRQIRAVDDSARRRRRAAQRDTWDSATTRRGTSQTFTFGRRRPIGSPANLGRYGCRRGAGLHHREHVCVVRQALAHRMLRGEQRRVPQVAACLVDREVAVEVKAFHRKRFQQRPGQPEPEVQPLSCRHHGVDQPAGHPQPWPPLPARLDHRAGCGTSTLTAKLRRRYPEPPVTRTYHSSVVSDASPMPADAN